MKFILPIIFPLFLSSQVWVKIADYPGDTRDDGVAAVVGNKAFFGSGAQQIFGLGKDFHVLDLSSDVWENISDLPDGEQRQYACAFSGPGCFFITCGDGINGATNSTYKYTVATNSWTPMASKPGAGLIAASCMTFGDKIIIVGGKFQNNVPSNEIWEYTISNNTWTQKNNFPFIPIYRASGTSVNTTGYLLFGIDANGSFRKELYSYDQLNDSWQLLSNFPTTYGRAYGAMHAINGNLFVFGGSDSLSVFFADCWYYKLAGNQWMKGPDLPSTPRRGGLSCVANGNFYFSCGLGPIGRLKETWRTDVPVSAMKEESEQDNFVIFPNPASHAVTISTTKKHQDVTVSLYSIEGIFLDEINTFENYVRLNLEKYPPGIYYLQITTGEAVFTRKIIKE